MSDYDFFEVTNAIRLDQGHGKTFEITLPAPPDDGRCVAGWGLLAHGYPDSARCQNKTTMPDLTCLECHVEFSPRNP